MSVVAKIAEKARVKRLALTALLPPEDENALVESGVVPPLVKILTALPGSTLGFIPSDFKVSLEILKQNIDV